MSNDVGRPPVIDNNVLNKLEQAFSLGATDLEACFFAGISHQTLYNYQNKNPEFIERKEALKDKLILKSRQVVSEALDNGDKQTAQWYLERKKKDEFAVKTQTDIQPLDRNGQPTDLSKQIENLPKDQAYKIFIDGKL